jgi:predicted HNH restriction endonuclease
MYENKTGVVAAGEVSNPWDGKKYQQPHYYKKSELDGEDGGPFEYRIAVNWYMDITNKPITLDRLRTAFNSNLTPRGSVKLITKHHEAAVRLLNKVQSELKSEIQTFSPIATDHTPPDRKFFIESRIIRDTKKSMLVKQLHNFKCQICGYTINLPNGKEYAEAHHLKPLGKPHNGPDVVENLICVCPNHHAMLDYGAIALDMKELQCIDGHHINLEYIDYHNKTIHPASP